MAWQSGTFVTIIFLAALATLAMGIYAWRYRSAAPGALWFALLMLAISLWVAMSGLEMLAADRRLSILCSQIIYIGSLSVGPLLLRFTAAYSGHDRWLGPVMRYAIWVVPATAIGLVWTNPLHGWVWPAITPAPAGAAVPFVYDHGPAVVVAVAYSYALIIGAAWLLVRRALEVSGDARRSLLAMVLATLMPLVANALYFAGAVPAGSPDVTALAFALSAVVGTFLVFSGRLLDVAPVAYDALVRTMQDGIVVVDGDGRLRGLNRAACRLLAVPPDLVGSPADAALASHPDILTALVTREERTEVFAHGNPHGRWLELSVSDITLRGGKTAGRLALLHDISDYRRTQDELRHSETTYRQLFDTAAEAIFIQDEDGRFIDVNRGACELFGCPCDSFVGKLPRDFSADDRNDLREIERLVRAAYRGTPACFEFWGRRADQTAMPLEVRLDAGMFFGQQVVIAHAVDITDRKGAEEEMRAAGERLRRSLESTVAAMGQMIEHRDPYTAVHERRVTQLVVALADELELDPRSADGLRLASEVHDIGKIAVPADILSRPGPLTAAELQIVARHPQVGYEILRSIEFDWPVADIVRDHHERLDGSGYPRGLVGTAIHPEARVLAVADVVEAMLSHRPYRHAHELDEVLATLAEGRGALYDADAVDACLRLFRERGFAFID